MVAVAVSAFPFDTLAYANKLKAVGIESRIAEAQAELQAQVLCDFVKESIANKVDIANVRADITKTRSELKTEIAELRSELKAEIAEVRTEIAELRSELKAEIAEVRTELKAEIAEVRTEIAEVKEEIAELKIDVAEIKNDLASMQNKLIIKLGGIMAGGIAIIGVMLSIVTH